MRMCFKMTDRGLRCRGYQFKEDVVNTCDAATCVREGFHAAENPLDCFSYYSSFKNSEFWLCLADGEIHEDLSDTKLSCTELVFVKRLELFEVVAFACQYILRNPKRKLSAQVKHDMGQTDSNGYVIVIGKDPLGGCAVGGKAIGLVRTDESGTPVEFAVLTGNAIKEGNVYKKQAKATAGADPNVMRIRLALEDFKRTVTVVSSTLGKMKEEGGEAAQKADKMKAQVETFIGNLITEAGWTV